MHESKYLAVKNFKSTKWYNTKTCNQQNDRKGHTLLSCLLLNTRIPSGQEKCLTNNSGPYSSKQYNTLRCN